MKCRDGFLPHRFPCTPPVEAPSEWPVGQRIFERGIPLIPWLQNAAEVPRPLLGRLDAQVSVAAVHTCVGDGYTPVNQECE